MVAVGRFGILADGRPIRLGSRAFDALMALIEISGAVIGKDEALAQHHPTLYRCDGILSQFRFSATYEMP
jgi:hypothetical protein